MNPSDEHADSVFYEIAVEEVQAGRVDKGLMAKAIAKAYGDKKKAGVLYLEWRVGLLKEQAVEEAKAAKERLKEAAAKEAKAASEDFQEMVASKAKAENAKEDDFVTVFIGMIFLLIVTVILTYIVVKFIELFI